MVCHFLQQNARFFIQQRHITLDHGHIECWIQCTTIWSPCFSFCCNYRCVAMELVVQIWLIQAIVMIQNDLDVLRLTYTDLIWRGGKFKFLNTKNDLIPFYENSLNTNTQNWTKPHLNWRSFYFVKCMQNGFN